MPLPITAISKVIIRQLTVFQIMYQRSQKRRIKKCQNSKLSISSIKQTGG
ncbi:hypothetical protein ACINWCA157_2755 [Acinetobacter radioresistens WC-A-157]|nr:hypothetical protein ACINWCA157_2755 [Acinetobacter radioresistens WC-A-157]